MGDQPSSAEASKVNSANVQDPRMIELQVQQALWRFEQDKIEASEKNKQAAEETRKSAEENRKSAEETERMRFDNCIAKFEAQKQAGMDERDKKFYKDFVRSELRYAKRKLEFNPSEGEDNTNPELKRIKVGTFPDNREISIMLVANDLRICVGDRSGNVGKKLVQLWREKYNYPISVHPPKRDALFRGRPCQENAYFQRDYDIVESAIRFVCDVPKPDIWAYFRRKHTSANFNKYVK